MVEELTNKQKAERGELISSLKKEDIFEKRKYSSPSSACSGFLIATFWVTVLSTVAFWSGTITVIDI